MSDFIPPEEDYEIYENGDWCIEEDEDGNLEITFDVIRKGGVEKFNVGMPPKNALEFGEAVVNLAKELLDD
jgi:hypothetical protein